MAKKQYDEEQPIYRSRKDRHQRKKRKYSWIPIVLLICAFVIAAVAGALFASSSLFDKKAPEKTTEKMVPHNKTVVMIMGVDEREDDVGRSDTLMVATLDPKKHKASILSVPRDTRVKIKGYGFDKINAAYAYGGHKLTQSTVEDLLGVSMEHYILINVNAFTKIIDAIGGVDINVEKRMYYEDPWDDNGGLVIDLYPGEQHMDGKTAMTYVRYRDEEGDIGRITRQQKFMQAVMDKLTSPSIIPKIPAIISQVVDSIETDLSVKEMIEFAAALNEARSNGLQAEMLPGRPMYIDDISYWIPDLSKLRTTVANTLDVQISSSLRNATEREMQEYESSVPDDAQEIPMDEGTRHRLGIDSYDSSSERRSSRHYSTTEGNRLTEKADKDSDDSMSNPFAEDGDFYEEHIPDRSHYDSSYDSSSQDADIPAQTPAMTVPSTGKTAN